MKGLMDHCMPWEQLVDCLKERAETAEMGLHKLEAQREVQIRKLDLTKKALEKSEEKTEVLTNVLKDKEGEVSLLRKQVRHAKEDAVKEFRDFDALLYELGICFADGFNNCLCQVKASFLDLDLSQISIDASTQTLARPINPEGIDKLFGVDLIFGAQGDGKAALQDD